MQINLTPEPCVNIDTQILDNYDSTMCPQLVEHFTICVDLQNTHEI